MTWDLNIISAKIFAPIVIILGSLGNFVGLYIISNKKLKQMGPHIIYICMFVLDCIYLPLIFHPYLDNAFNIDLTAMSNTACKAYWYARYSMAIISPMMNVYISVERFISITYPARKFFLQKKNVQVVYILVIILLNFLFAVPIALGFELQFVKKAGSNQSESIVYYCDFGSMYWQNVIGFIDMVTRVIVPSLLMVIGSIMISASILRSRFKNAAINANNATLRKDIRFAAVSIGLNLFYIMFSLPVSVVVLLQDFWDNQYYIPFSFLFFVAYCANFYLMIGFNRLFRNTFATQFSRICSLKPNRNPTQMEHTRIRRNLENNNSKKNKKNKN